MLNRKSQPIIQEFKKFTIIPPEQITLPNGIVMNVLNSGDNEVVRIDFLIVGGRWNQTHPLQALFTNRMLREGTKKYTASQIAEKLDYYGAWLELSIASEHAYITLYSLNKYLPQTLDILESILKEPTFPGKELEIVKNTNLQQFLVNSTKVDFLAHRALVKALYGENHPCGRLVKEEDYKNLQTDILHSFYNNYYHSSNCTIYIAGKITQECLKRMTKLFGEESFGENNHLITSAIHTPSSCADKQIFIERSDALQSAIRMGILTIDRCHPDFLKLRVLITLFGGYFGSRLMANIRENKGYTYGISATVLSYPAQSVLNISTETANEYVEPLIAEVYHEIDRLQQELVSDEELTLVKNYMLGDMCRNCESAFSLSDSWMFVHASKLPLSYFDDALIAINSITPQEIRNLAEQYLCKENLKEVVAGKKI